MTSSAEGPNGRAAARRARARRQRNTTWIGLVIVAAVAAFFAVWWTTIHHHSSSNTQSSNTAATAVSEAQLQSYADSMGVPIYWAGPKAGYTYEYSRYSGTRVYVRYLPAGVAVGSASPYLTIGTYAVANAYSVSETYANRGGEVKVPVSGGIGFYSTSNPDHVYLAFPGLNYQIEVYDPAPDAALALVNAGKVVQVAAPATSSPSTTQPSAPQTSTTAGIPAHAASEADIAKLATAAHPIYWVGAETDKTYELTVTASGRVYVRYLPHGVAVGTASPYLTIGMYPVANAYSVVEGLSNRAGWVKQILTPSEVATYQASRPTHVYVAYHGVNEEIEVYDPNQGSALALVKARRLTAIT